jgi:hypothetical protein
MQIFSLLRLYIVQIVMTEVYMQLIHVVDLRFSWWWLWRMPSCGMLCCVALVRTDVPPKSQFLQESQGITSKKMAFFINVLFIYCNQHYLMCNSQYWSRQFCARNNVVYHSTVAYISSSSSETINTLEMQISRFC